MDQNNGRNGLDAVFLLVEFLEIAIHQILFIRRLYPISIFSLKKKYNIPIWISSHPGVNSYINQTLKAVKELSSNQKFHSVSVIFLSSNKDIIEKHTLDVLNLQPELTDRSDLQSDPYLIKLGVSLRDYCLKLGSHEYKPLPPGSSFQIVVCTTEQGSVGLSNNPSFQDFPFVNTEEKKCTVDNPSLIPIHTVNCDLFCVQTYMYIRSES